MKPATILSLLGGDGLPPSFVWNSADKDADVTLSNSNQTMASSSGGAVRGGSGRSVGQWYFEVRYNRVSGNVSAVGIGKSTADISLSVGVDPDSYGYWFDGTLRNNSNTLSTPPAYGNTDIIGVALNLNANAVSFYLNGSLAGSTSISAGTYYPMVGANVSDGWTLTRPITYPAPSGYNYW